MFFDLTHFRELRQKYKNIFVVLFYGSNEKFQICFRDELTFTFPLDFQTFLRPWLRGNSAKQKQCFCIFGLAFRTLFPKIQWERPIKSKWVEPWTFGSIDLKCCIWWFWIRTFDFYEIIWKVSTYHIITFLINYLHKDF